MKKLMTAFAACLIVGVAAAQIVSQNIVGYQTFVASGTYPSHGTTFITVGDQNKEWKLSDITAIGMEPSTDFIQFLDPADTSVSLMATYIDEANSGGIPALVGWWDLGIEHSLNDQSYTAGTGFLCNFPSGQTVTFTFAGEVYQLPNGIDCSGKTYPMIANPLPVDLTLGDITANGMEPSTDFIQFLDPADTSVSLMATYIDEANSGGIPALVGWWDLGIEHSLNDQSFPAGTAVLGNFPSGNSVMVTFPSPL